MAGPTLFCVFTDFADFADRTPLVGFHFRIAGGRSPPTDALVFQREQDGSQAEFAGHGVPSPEWVFDGAPQRSRQEPGRPLPAQRVSAIAPAAVHPARASARLLAVPALAAGGAQAQGAAVAAGEAPDLETGRAATAAIGRQLSSIAPRVSDLRTGCCGSVDVRNRMGSYTGPRPFVFEPGTGVAGRLPEGPELRSPASMAAYRAMERARALFAAHGIDR